LVPKIAIYRLSISSHRPLLLRPPVYNGRKEVIAVTAVGRLLCAGLTVVSGLWALNGEYVGIKLLVSGGFALAGWCCHEWMTVMENTKEMRHNRALTVVSTISLQDQRTLM